MTAATITKILNNPDLKDESMSLGFRRFTVLPNRVQKNLMAAHLIQTGNIDYNQRIKDFFAEMTEDEYLEYLKTH